MYQPQQNNNTYASKVSANNGREQSTSQYAPKGNGYTTKSATYMIPRSVRKTNTWKKQATSTANKQQTSLITTQNRIERKKHKKNQKEITTEKSEEKKQVKCNLSKHTFNIKYNATRTEDVAWQTHQLAAHVFHVVSWTEYMDNKYSNNSKMKMKILEKGIYIK